MIIPLSRIPKRVPLSRIPKRVPLSRITLKKNKFILNDTFEIRAGVYTVLGGAVEEWNKGRFEFMESIKDSVKFLDLYLFYDGYQIILNNDRFANSRPVVDDLFENSQSDHKILIKVDYENDDNYEDKQLSKIINNMSNLENFIFIDRFSYEGVSFIKHFNKSIPTLTKLEVSNNKELNQDFINNIKDLTIGFFIIDEFNNDFSHLSSLTILNLELIEDDDEYENNFISKYKNKLPTIVIIEDAC